MGYSSYINPFCFAVLSVLWLATWYFGAEHTGSVLVWLIASLLLTAAFARHLSMGLRLLKLMRHDLSICWGLLSSLKPLSREIAATREMDQLFYDDTHSYSVDAIHEYINTTQPPIVRMPVSELEHNLLDNCWDMHFTPRELIEQSVETGPWSDVAEHLRRIADADLAYPIVVTGSHPCFVVDGMHRLSKAILNKHVFIAVHILDNETMKRFVIS
jgi:hypothetical protein